MFVRRDPEEKCPEIFPAWRRAGGKRGSAPVALNSGSSVPWRKPQRRDDGARRGAVSTNLWVGTASRPTCPKTTARDTVHGFPGLSAAVMMQQGPFICRSCLQRLRTPWPVPLRAQHLRHLTQLASSKPSATRETRDALPYARPETGQSRHRHEIGVKPDDSLGKWTARRSSPSPAGPETPEIDRDAASEECFEDPNYPVQDEQFWGRFNEIWDEPQAGGKPGGISSEQSHSQIERNADDGEVLDNRAGDKPETLPRRTIRAKQAGSFARTAHGPGRKRAPRLPEKRVIDKDFVAKAQIRYLRWKSSDDEFPGQMAKFRRWKKTMGEAFAEQRLLLRPARAVPQAAHQHPTAPKLRWLLEHDSVDKMRDAWMTLPPEQRETLWPDMLKSCVRSRPESLIMVLQATCADVPPPRYAVQDIFEFLVRRSRQLPPGERESCCESLGEFLVSLLTRFPSEEYQLRQNVLARILVDVEDSKREHLYHTLVEDDHPLHHNTLLQFASRFAKRPAQKQLATDILVSVVHKETSFDINGPVGASLCTSILHMGEEATEQVSESPPPAQLFERLLKLGFQPNVIIYSTLIRNLCLAKEMDAAWQVYDVMVHHDIKPDAHIYSILLNGAKLADDFTSIRRVLDHAYADKIRNFAIGNEVLHATLSTAVAEARRRRLKSPRVVPVFPFMLQAYTKMFHLDPLKPFLVGDLKYFEKEFLHWKTTPAPWRFPRKVSTVIDGLPSWEEDRLLQPDGLTLAFMIMGHVQSFSNQYSVIAFYTNFRKMLKEGHPAAERIVREQGSIVHDIIIKKLLEWPGMLRSALDVVGDMLKDSISSISSTPTLAVPADPHTAGTGNAPAPSPSPSPSTAPAPPPSSGAALRHPAPTVYTWSILLDGFMQYKRHGQAERILQMMRQHGVRPCRVTWNTLVAGYAREQKISKTVRALQRLEADGFEADEWTLRAFSYLQNKHRAIAEMEAMIARRERRRLQQEQAQAQELQQDQAHAQALEGQRRPEEVAVEELERAQMVQVGTTEADLRRLESEVEDMARIMDRGPGSGP